MRERGKSVEVFAAGDFIPCKKHPNSPSVGICPHCLKDRLVRLVCSECGEQRLSSCSCSDVSSSSYRNSMEVGSVGRVSFLIENDKIDPNPRPQIDQLIFLRRSTSSCVEVKKANGFRKIKSLFNKTKKKKSCDEIWVSDVMGVSRSRSLCSFRAFDDDRSAFSSAKISDADRQFGGFSDFEHRRSDFRGMGCNTNTNHNNRIRQQNILAAKEGHDFSDDSAFIDLKVEEFSGGRISCSSDLGGGLEAGVTSTSSGALVNERRKGRRVWKWIFKYHNKGDK